MIAAINLTPLVLLACPIGMGLMMVFMARGMGSGTKRSDERSVDELRQEQERLSGEVARLEAQAKDRDLANNR